MNWWLEHPDAWDDVEPFDPLCVERSAPIGDEEAAAIEELCRTATPGPMTFDDEDAGEGSIVAILPDGRVIATLMPYLGADAPSSTVEANAQLICKARYLLLRLLRDRKSWLRERRELLERIQSLEEAVVSEKTAGGHRRASVGSKRPR